MPRTLTVAPDLPDTIQTVNLGGQTVRVRMRWYDRLAAWYLDVTRLDGTILGAGIRVSPGWFWPDGLRPEGFPPGRLFFRGSEPYAQSDLGGRVAIVWIEDSEVPAAQPFDDDDGLRFAPVT